MHMLGQEVSCVWDGFWGVIMHRVQAMCAYDPHCFRALIYMLRWVALPFMYLGDKSLVFPAPLPH